MQTHNSSDKFGEAIEGSDTRAGLVIRYLENCAVIPHGSDFLAYCIEQRELRTNLGFEIFCA